jgi:DNA polymerase III epsilon subunit-like protein
MAAKKHYMVLDTETVADARVPFDLGFTIIDRRGNIVEQGNFFTAEIVDNPTGLYLLCKDSFSRRKAAFYLEAAKQQPQNVMPFDIIADIINDKVAECNATVCAYNAKFDVTVCENFAQALGMPYFFAPGTEVWDIWNIALNIFCKSRNYVNFARANGFVTEKNNVSSSAETVYRYLTNNPAFIESHTALDDTNIEAEILAQAFKRHKPLVTEFAGAMFHHPIWKTYLAG